MPRSRSIIAIASGSIWGIVSDIPHYLEPPHFYTNSMAALVPRNGLIVVERADIFVEAVETEPGLQLRYLLDWDTAMLPESPRGEVSGYHELENLQRAGYHAASIEQSSEFLARQADFWVITDPTEQWFARRIQNNLTFATQKVGTFQREDRTETVWHIHRLQ